jgi:hypothetical protein
MPAKIHQELVRPSYSQGIAQYAGQSAWPEIWNGLVYLTFAGDASRTPRDIAGRQFCTIGTSTVASVVSNLGMAWNNFGGTDAGDVITVPQPSSLDGSSAWTAMVVSSMTSAVIGRGAFGVSDQVGGIRFAIKPTGSNAANRFGIWFNEHLFDVNVGTLTDGLMRAFIFRSRSAIDHAIFLDGISQGTATASHSLPSNVSIVFGHDHRTQPWHGQNRMAAMWDYALSDAAINRVGLDPEIIVRPKQRVFYSVPAAVGADVRNHIIPAYMRINA